jgi:hypothetical protein
MLHTVEEILSNDRLVQAANWGSVRVTGQRNPSGVYGICQYLVERLRGNLLAGSGRQALLCNDSQHITFLVHLRIHKFEGTGDQWCTLWVGLDIGACFGTDVHIANRRMPWNTSGSNRLTLSISLLLRVRVREELVECAEDVSRELARCRLVDVALVGRPQQHPTSTQLPNCFGLIFVIPCKPAQVLNDYIVNLASTGLAECEHPLKFWPVTGAGRFPCIGKDFNDREPLLLAIASAPLLLIDKIEGIQRLLVGRNPNVYDCPVPLGLLHLSL